MTWGSKRRARAANIFGDTGKIVLATAVIGPMFSPQPAARVLMLMGAAVASACFVVAVWMEKED